MLYICHNFFSELDFSVYFEKPAVDPKRCGFFHFCVKCSKNFQKNSQKSIKYIK